MDAVNWTFQYHGSPSGTILADEIQHNLAPYMGSELCTAVETAYSLIYMYQVLGDNMFADRAERTIFNALPVMLTGNKWAHQYMDQPNQPWAVNNTQDFIANAPHVFTTANSGVATTYGMEPLYPCCTVNHPQGYPKFTTNSWARVGDNGLVHALLSPSTVTTTVAGSDVSINCDTTYPFGNTLTYTIIAKNDFDFYIRVPSWINTASSELVVNGASSSPSPNSNGLHLVAIKTGKTTVKYTIDAALRTESRSNNTVAVYYGNILYALDVGFQETSSYPHAYFDATGPGIEDLPYPELRDYYISNSSTWNVAIDPSTLKYHGMGKDTTLADPIFAQAAPPNFITVQGCIVTWDLYLDATPEWAPTNTACLGGKKEYKLRPYGAVKVHMSELPTVKL
ncbi:hypothetical protein N7510_004462 [Penicillium lagena]|uniref:uncharacterized protein n=1 Tax=Penicillium lagena TaxID=94218 RepID=UPI002540576F|nr:uncharacterized protein N7510_004462 [Penicillium lagena]KAJ5620478.1 hypothetical protein N7510_004462 [Penicillium lagena]